MHSLPENDVVLLGVGHTHAHVLRMWAMQPIANARLTCVAVSPVATYSGMLPGVLAGQYDRSAMELDLVRLCAAAGARLVLGDATGLDLEARRVLMRDRPPIPFDVLSVGVGSVPSWAGVDVADASRVVAIKPMQTLLDRLDGRLDEWRATRTASEAQAPLRMLVVGAGAGGVEIALCLPAWLRRRVGPSLPIEVTVLAGEGRLVPGARTATAARVATVLAARGARWRPGRVSRVDGHTVQLTTGETLSADLIVWATGAAPPPLVSVLGLERDAHGFLATHDTLQCVSHSSVFAVGDTGTIVASPTPKAGVYAVRQGPVLWRNLARALAGQPLERYRPQTDFLKLLNVGEGRAVGEWRGVSFEGEWVWRLKDRIDSRFMAMYHLLAEGASRRAMGATDASPAARTDPTEQMRCVGCGGKVAGSILSRALARLEVPSSSHVTLGLEAGDDGAVVRAGGDGSVVVTVDAFVAPFDDPFVMGRIALLNAASDAFAMGARPWGALATVTLPIGPARQQEELLFQLLAGALVELRAMGATLVGGHTIEGDALQIGFTILASPGTGAPRTKGGIRPGDRLVLTKPLGTGVLLAAHMRGQCRASWWPSLLASMLRSNAAAAATAQAHGVTGLTDVTGFGLAGHLVEMIRASRVSVRLDLAAVPLLPGAETLLAGGLESTLAPANRDVEPHLTGVTPAVRVSSPYRALFDPQTGGGLLIGVPSAQSQSLVSALHEAGDLGAVVVGNVDEAAGTPSVALAGAGAPLAER